MAKVSLRLLVALVAAMGTIGGTAFAQSPPSCVSSIPPGLTGDKLAVAKASAGQADRGRSQLPADAHVLGCNTAVGTLPIPAGVQVPAAPGFGQRAHTRQSGTAYLGFIGCSITGQGWYASTPTYIHVSMWWSCSGAYASMSGVFVMETPSHGSWAHGPVRDYYASDGYANTDFTYVPWFGYHNRAYWEYGYFCFSNIGCMNVYTNHAFI